MPSAPVPPAVRLRRRRATRTALLLCGALLLVILAPRALVPGPTFPGSVVPSGDLAADSQGPRGWTQVFSDDFLIAEQADSDGDLPSGTWWGYPAGTPITNSPNGVYDPGRVVRVQDGKMIFSGSASGSTAYGAVMAPRVAAAQTYGRYDVRYRYLDEQIGGFKSVWMLWPDSNDWGDGEIDFAEYSTETSDRVGAAVHEACGMPPCRFVTNDVAIDPLGWHTATVIWSPGRVTTYLDGRKLTTATIGVPDTSMHVLLQFEASSKVMTEPGASATVEVDWISVYRRA